MKAAHFSQTSAVISIILTSLLTGFECQYFQAKERRPYNYYRIVNDPNQVIPDEITQDNLFAWMNLKNLVRFKLWTRKNPHLAHEIKYNNLKSLKTSNFDSRRVTKVLIHGYADTATEEAVTYYLFHLRDAYLSMADVNVIILDYSLFMTPLFYYTSLGTLAAARLTEFLTFLVKYASLDLNSVHLVGFSWGAHVAGIAGHKLKGSLGRITGLDPAGPTFRYLDNEDRLDKSDAKFVDIIHTNGGNRLWFGGNLGLPDALGHVDVYPNGGNKQIGCPQETLIIYESLECSHGRSARYFIESITSPLAFPLSCPCDDFQKFIRNECSCPEDHPVSFMGEHMPHLTRGIYQIITRAQKPFGHGPPFNVSLPNVLEMNGTLSTAAVLAGNRTLRVAVDDSMLSTNATKAETVVNYKGVTYRVLRRNTFKVREYPNDDVIDICLDVMLKSLGKFKTTADVIF